MSKAIQLKIVIAGTQPPVWRRIHILANSTLASLQFAITDAFEWGYMHGYLFTIGEDTWSWPEMDEYSDGWLDDSKMTVGRIAAKFLNFQFIYNLQANWIHQIIVEDIFEAKKNERYPVCVDGAFAAPPFGCNSLEEFENLRKANSHVKRKRPRNKLDLIRAYEPIDDWRDFDPSFFDVRIINEIKLSRRKKLPSRKKRK